MTDTAVEAKPIVALVDDDKPTVITADERIAFRGPIQRLLVSPEIGAIIGAVLVWAFFWGNGQTFGTAATTLIILDSAAPLGIMAVAVALLMIGGEFDLSAGMMTGATGILVGLMVKYFTDTGAPMWLAVGAAFVLAGTIGYFNGSLVNRTGLPSFIVTLATFFVLKGLTLVLAKRLEGKVSVSGIKADAKIKSFGTFYRVFAQDYKPKNFTGRDVSFFSLAIGGLVLVIVGLCEQSFVRRKRSGPDEAPTSSARYLGLGVIGVAAAVLGFLMLHKTDGVANNTVWGLVTGVGAILGIVSLALSRYQARSDPAAEPDHALRVRVRELMGFGLGAMLLACLTPLLLKRDERREILTWFPSWLRVVVAVVAAATGVSIAARQAWPRLRERFRWYSPIQAMLFSAAVGLLLLTGSLALFQLTTVQALRAVAMMALAGVGLSMLLRARAQAGKFSSKLQLAIGLATSATVVILAFVVRHDSGAERFRSELFGAMMIGATILAANALLETRLLKRKAPDVRADRLGRRLLALGAVLAGIGLSIRIVFTNLASGLQVKGKGFSVTRMSIVWWIVATLVGAFILTKTKWGNWIFAVGGNKEAARAIGVPANRVKTALFVTVSLVGCFVGVMVLLRFGSVQASQGDGLEFFYIIAAVVGGNLLTGGYGSVVGASVGALIMTMSDSGIAAAGWNQDGKFAFKGIVLLVAVLVNNFIRKKAQEAR
jgi:ribose/xylose/arabinose/galactoside ABC-type transport system permease subunit